jgi:hypothetical protein
MPKFNAVLFNVLLACCALAWTGAQASAIGPSGDGYIYPHFLNNTGASQTNFEFRVYLGALPYSAPDSDPWGAPAVANLEDDLGKYLLLTYSSTGPGKKPIAANEMLSFNNLSVQFRSSTATHTYANFMWTPSGMVPVSATPLPPSLVLFCSAITVLAAIGWSRTRRRFV